MVNKSGRAGRRTRGRRARECIVDVSRRRLAEGGRNKKHPHVSVDEEHRYLEECPNFSVCCCFSPLLSGLGHFLDCF